MTFGANMQNAVRQRLWLSGEWGVEEEGEGEGCLVAWQRATRLLATARTRTFSSSMINCFDNFGLADITFKFLAMSDSQPKSECVVQNIARANANAGVEAATAAFTSVCGICCHSNSATFCCPRLAPR